MAIGICWEAAFFFDMEEKKTDNSINLIKSLETLTEEIKVGNRQRVTEILEQIEHEIKGHWWRKLCLHLSSAGDTCHRKYLPVPE